MILSPRVKDLRYLKERRDNENSDEMTNVVDCNTVPADRDTLESLQREGPDGGFSPVSLGNRRCYQSKTIRGTSCTLPNSQEVGSGNEAEKPFRISKKKNSNSLSLPKGAFVDNAQKSLPNDEPSSEIQAETKEVEPAITEENGERQQQDSFFEDFDNQFVVKFPSPASKALLGKGGYSPYRVNKALTFHNEQSEVRSLTNLDNPVNDLNKRSASVKEGSRIASSYQQILKEVTPAQHDSELPSLKETYESVVYARDYRRHQPTLRLETQNDLRSQHLSRNPRYPQTMKLNSQLLFPRGEKRGNRASVTRNESVFANLVSNRTYRDYNQVANHTRANCKDFIDENWKIFEKTRERLAATKLATQPANSSNITASLMAATHQRSLAEELDKENKIGGDWPKSYLGGGRRRSRHFTGNEPLTDVSIPIKTSIAEKENIFNTRVSGYDHDRYTQEVARLNSRVSENQMGIARVFDYKNKRRATIGQKDLRVGNERHLNDSNPFVLRDLTNRISTNESFRVLNTDRSQPSEKKEHQSQHYVPKPAYEILRESRKEYENRKNSQTLSLASRIHID